MQAASARIRQRLYLRIREGLSLLLSFRTGFFAMTFINFMQLLRLAREEPTTTPFSLLALLLFQLDPSLLTLLKLLSLLLEADRNHHLEGSETCRDKLVYMYFSNG